MKAKTRLIKRTSRHGATSKSSMEDACQKYADDFGYKFIKVSKNWRWAYCADFQDSEGNEFSGVMIALATGDPDWPEEVDVIFGPGQMVGSEGHVVEEDEYFDELGIGE